MKANITEEMLMSYLYGEITAEEKRLVEAYLKDNPEKQQELEGLGQIRGAMNAIREVEDVAVPIFTMEQAVNKSTDNLYKRLAIAASVAFLISLAWIGYSSLIPKEREVMTNNQQLDQILNHQSTLEQQNEQLIARILEMENKIAQVSVSQQQQSERISTLQKSGEADTQAMVNEYMAGMREENRQWLDQYFTVANAQQQEYLQNVLVDFGDYMQEQRRQDFQILQTRLMNLEQNTDQFQSQAAEIMARLTNDDVQLQNY